LSTAVTLLPQKPNVPLPKINFTFSFVWVMINTSPTISYIDEEEGIEETETLHKCILCDKGTPEYLDKPEAGWFVTSVNTNV
jgi:hypothetical protein